MKIDILRQRENKVLNRREIDFRIEHVGGTTPSRADIRARLAADLNSDPSAVVIRLLKTKYGIGITEGIARIYKDAEQAKSIEIAYVLKRHEPKKKEEEAGEVAEKPTKGKAPEKAEKKKPEKEAEEAEERPEKETGKAEKKPEKKPEKAEKKPEKEAEKAEKRPEKPEKGTEKAEKKPDKKKKAEAADEDEDEEES